MLVYLRVEYVSIRQESPQVCLLVGLSCDFLDVNKDMLVVILCTIFLFRGCAHRCLTDHIACSYVLHSRARSSIYCTGRAKKTVIALGMTEIFVSTAAATSPSILRNP